MTVTERARTGWGWRRTAADQSLPGAEPATPRPIWFGPADRPLAGFLHEPRNQQCVGGVLICAPFGYEATCAYRTLRELGARLAASGLLVLRFDYFGTGASSGEASEVVGLDTWQASVRAGIAELRRRGIARPALLGLRLGAALAYTVASEDSNLGPLVLWAPVTSGRRYQRELRGQAAVSPGGIVGDGALNVFGHLIAAEAVRDIRSWEPLCRPCQASDVLVLESPDWRDRADAITDITEAGIAHTLLEAPGTAAMLERDAEVAVVPHAIVEAVARWLEQRVTGRVTYTAESLDMPTAAMDAPTFRVREQIVSVPRAGLYGVLTRPAGPVPKRGVLFLNNGVAPAAGPGRAWVEFSRALAAEGIGALRLDFSGLGDSPDPRRAPWRTRLPSSGGPELLEAVEFLRAQGIRHITVVGLCSGGIVAVRTAAVRSGLDQIVAINPRFYNQAAIGLSHRWWWVPPAIGVLMDKRPVRRIALRQPFWCWALLDKLHACPLPTTLLRRARMRGARVRLIYSPDDAGLDDFVNRGGRRPAAVTATGHPEPCVLPGLDHSMFDRVGRAAVLELLRGACRGGSAPAFDGDSRD